MINSMEMTPEREMCFRWRNTQVWTRQRVELRDALFEIAPYLAELYQGAVLLLYQCSIPGRARLIAHAVREIGNGLPEKMAGKSFPDRFDPTDELNIIVAEWAKCGFFSDGHPTIPDDARTDVIRDKGPVEVPLSLFKKLSKLLKRHDQSRTSNREKTVELFKACDPQNPGQIELLVPVVQQWLNVVRWFVSLVHERKRSDDEILQGKFMAQFDVFETGLRAMTTDFFGTTSEELDEILENANS